MAWIAFVMSAAAMCGVVIASTASTPSASPAVVRLEITSPAASERPATPLP